MANCCMSCDWFETVHCLNTQQNHVFTSNSVSCSPACVYIYKLIACIFFSLHLQDLYVYISEEEVFSDFNNTESLFWFHRDLVYGDWTMGENGDGCYEHYKELDIPEVRQKDVCVLWGDVRGSEGQRGQGALVLSFQL